MLSDHITTLLFAAGFAATVMVVLLDWNGGALKQ
jgi:hypothetical protein